jgi:hypothetical protein
VTDETRTAPLEERLAAVIAHHQQHGTLPAMDDPQLDAMARQYLTLASSLDTCAFDGGMSASTLPAIEGFRTVERLGSGGMGDVYKLQDLRLDRLVAAKIIKGSLDTESGGSTGKRLREFLREARALALFSDPRIVQIYECRTDSEPAVIIMEYVDGFELGRVGPSLEMRQRATVVRDVCHALQHAHQLGIQHRDLKPSNIMLDSALRPKILDFGLSDGNPASGHFLGTVHYIAPEQLDSSQPIDARTDVYALGVILYELVCGARPFEGVTSEILDAVRTGQPRLPREIDPQVPEPLQAIALKAMEHRPGDRYASAQDMAQDLDRYLSGRPVVARPTQYATTLGARVRPHVDQIGEWLRLKLIYPHEAARLTSAYQALEAREEDWIVASRELSYAQIALYLGAFFLFAGSLFYFVAHRVYGGATGMTGPLLILGLPFAGLNLAARRLYQRDHQAVAVAFFLGGLSLLPLFLLIWFHDWELWMAPAGDSRQFFNDGVVSNRQLQVTTGLACGWAAWLALRTRTSALSIVATIFLFLFGLAVLADFGLRGWLDDRRFDLLALHLMPLVLVFGAAGWTLERTERTWFARPAYVAGALTLLVALDLFALNGKLLHYFGMSMRSLQPADVESPVLLDTLTGLALNGILFYAIAAAVERRGTALMSTAAHVLFTIAPFSMLEPLAYLSETAIYHQRFDWIYLALAVGIAVLSHRRQRKSFYYAGVVNSGLALFLIANRHQWLDRPAWATTIVAVGLAVLVVGFLLEARRRRERRQ